MRNSIFLCFMYFFFTCDFIKRRKPNKAKSPYTIQRIRPKAYTKKDNLNQKTITRVKRPQTTREPRVTNLHIFTALENQHWRTDRRFTGPRREKEHARTQLYHLSFFHRRASIETESRSHPVHQITTHED